MLQSYLLWPKASAVIVAVLFSPSTWSKLSKLVESDARLRGDRASSRSSGHTVVAPKLAVSRDGWDAVVMVKKQVVDEGLLVVLWRLARLEKKKGFRFLCGDDDERRRFRSEWKDTSLQRFVVLTANDSFCFVS